MKNISREALELLAEAGEEARDELARRDRAEARARYTVLPIQDKIWRAVMSHAQARKDVAGNLFMEFAGSLPFKQLSDLPFSKPLDQYANEYEALNDLREQV